MTEYTLHLLEAPQDRWVAGILAKHVVESEGGVDRGRG